MIYQYAAQYAMKRPVAINVILSDKRPTNVLELTEVCMKHTILDLYIWLSLRFPDWFVEREKCLQMKEVCIDYVEGALELDDLKHKFCHADEYRKIRQQASRDRSAVTSLHPLPPVHFGSVREITADKLKDSTAKDLFSFPHQSMLRLGPPKGSPDKGAGYKVNRDKDKNRGQSSGREGYGNSYGDKNKRRDGPPKFNSSGGGNGNREQSPWTQDKGRRGQGQGQGGASQPPRGGNNGKQQPSGTAGGGAGKERRGKNTNSAGNSKPVDRNRKDDVAKKKLIVENVIREKEKGAAKA
jgi:hypothetical protein